MEYMQRYSELIELEIPAGQALTSTGFSFKDFAGGVLFLESGWTAANIGFKGSLEEEGSYVRIRQDDSDDTLEITTVPTAEAVMIILPPDLYSVSGFIKLWSKSTSADSDVVQTNAVKIRLMLKS